jgi:Protein of unknown function (DUF3592)
LASTNAASTSERDWPTLVVGGIFFLVGAIFGAIGLWKLYDAQRTLEGEQAHAEVLRKSIYVDHTEGARVQPKHRVDYRFTPARGEVVSASSDVTPELWVRLEPRAPIEVVYRADDPATHRVEGEARDPTVWIIFAIIGAFFAPVGGWLFRNGLPGGSARGGEIALPGWFARAPAFALGVIGMLFFLPFAAGGFFWLDSVRSAEELLELRGQQVEGIVLSKAIVTKSSGSSRGSRSKSTHYHVTYRFNADGADVVGVASLDADEWEGLKERGPVAVLYAGGSPWLHRIEGASAGWIAPVIFLGIGLIGMAGSGAAAVWGWRRRGQARPQRHEVREPPPVPKSPAKPAEKSQFGWLFGAGFGLLFFLGGGALLVEGIGDFLTERRYSAESRLADAQVTDKSMQQAERSGRRSTEYAVRYRFATADGAAAEGRAVLEANEWEATKPGDRIRVRYLPGEPQNSRRHDEGGYLVPGVMMAVGAVFALFGAFVAWGCWLARNDP